MQKTCFGVLFYLIMIVKSGNSKRIDNLQISKCSDQNYTLTISNVAVQFDASHVKVSGSLRTELDLVGPIEASVNLKRRIWGIWVPMPCEEELGSCTYSNLCEYGYPTNKTCPENFQQNNVPCRCPIKKGNYTILPTFDVSSQTSILSGTYKGTVTITQTGQFLSCYSIYFNFYDDENVSYKEYSVQQI